MLKERIEYHEGQVMKAKEKADRNIAALHYLAGVAEYNHSNYSKFTDNVFASLENAIHAMNSVSFGVNTGQTFIQGQKPDNFAVQSGLADYELDERYYVGCKMEIKPGIEYVYRLRPTAEGKRILDRYNEILASDHHKA